MAQNQVKVQMRGHCQCCGREQAVVTGTLMSKHGYEVPGWGNGGYFKGVCAGQHYQPIEYSRAHADLCIASARKEAAEHLATADKVAAGKVLPQFCKGRYIPEEREYAKVPWAEADQWQRRDAVQALEWNHRNWAKAATNFADGLERLCNEYHGKPLVQKRLDDGPEPIPCGQKRQGARGVLTARDVYRGMVRWTMPNGDKVLTGKMSTRSWRLLAKVD